LTTDIRVDLMRDSLRAASQARQLIVNYANFHIGEDDLGTGLGLIKAQEAIVSNWEIFKADKELYPCLEIYQIINSLSGDLEYQLRVYGMGSLKDDQRQLEVAMKTIKRNLGMESINKDNYLKIIESKVHGEQTEESMLRFM